MLLAPLVQRTIPGSATAVQDNFSELCGKQKFIGKVRRIAVAAERRRRNEDSREACSLQPALPRQRADEPDRPSDRFAGFDGGDNFSRVAFGRDFVPNPQYLTAGADPK